MIFAGAVPGAMGEMGVVAIRIDWERWELEPVGAIASAIGWAMLLSRTYSVQLPLNNFPPRPLAPRCFLLHPVGTGWLGLFYQATPA